MNVTQELREAMAIAAGLREAAGVCTPEQNVLKTRLVVAAIKLDELAILTSRSFDRIETLQQERAGAIAGRDEAIRQLGVTKEFAVAISRDEKGDALDAEDLILLLVAIDLLDRHTSDELAKAGNNTKQAAMINRRARLLILRAKLRTMQGEFEAANRQGGAS